MTENEEHSERVGADQPEKQAQDTSTDPLRQAVLLRMAGLTVAVAVGLYALREIPLPRRG